MFSDIRNQTSPPVCQYNAFKFILWWYWCSNGCGLTSESWTGSCTHRGSTFVCDCEDHPMEWCFSFTSFSWNMIFGYFWAGLRKLLQKNYQSRDVIFSPVVATCKSCQIRWFVMMWFILNLCSQFPVKNMCCVRRKSSNRTYHLTVFIYNRYISSKLPHLINEYSC